MTGMIASGVMLLVLGVPLVVLGVHLKKNPSAATAKGKKRKKKSGGEAAPPPKGVGSLVWGGAAFSLLGVGLLVAGLLKGAS